jgi:hypothetical protein
MTKKDSNEEFFGFGKFFSGKQNNQVVLSKKSGNEQIRQYFTQVCKLHDGGNEFPVDLDTVWPLVYSRKDKAVRALLDNEMFQEGVDYQILPQNGEKGRPTEKYMISIACMEYFIARKERAVFEVYRSVFHAARKQASLPVEDRVANMVIDNLAPVFETINAMMRRINDVEMLADKIEMTVKHGDPHATPPIKPQGREYGQYKMGDFIDARGLNFYTEDMAGEQVRCVNVERKRWRSMSDLQIIRKCRTKASQTAAQLNRAIPGSAQKIWLYAQTHPAWFVNDDGLELLMMNR